MDGFRVDAIAQLFEDEDLTKNEPRSKNVDAKPVNILYIFQVIKQYKCLRQSDKKCHMCIPLKCYMKRTRVPISPKAQHLQYCLWIH